jgi:hypothetical protein
VGDDEVIGIIEFKNEKFSFAGNACDYFAGLWCEIFLLYEAGCFVGE